MNGRFGIVPVTFLLCVAMGLSAFFAYNIGYNQARHNDMVEFEKQLTRINNQLRFVVEEKERNDAEAKKEYEKLVNSLQNLGLEITSITHTLENK